jgi:hypothetical protein
MTNEFAFTEPGPLGATIFLAIFNFIMIFGSLIIIIFMIKRRHHKMLSVRNPTSLILHILASIISCVFFSLSIILGKSTSFFCPALDAMYILVPVTSIHTNLAFPALVFASDANDLKVSRARGDPRAKNVLAFTMRKAFTPFMRLFCTFIVAGIQVGIFYALKYGASYEVVYGGDCNRAAQIAWTTNMFIFFTLLGYFMVRASKIKDPFFMNSETSLGSALCLVQLILMIVYPLAPQVFPSTFDYRWNIIFLTPVPPFCNGLFGLLLTFDWFEQRLEKWKGTVMHEDSCQDIDTKGTIYALSKGVDVFEVVLSNKTLLEAFTSFTLSQWSVENVLFYEAIEEFKDKWNTDSESAREFALMIISEYVTDGAPLEVNLDFNIKRNLEESIHEGLGPTTFNSAQKSVFKLMENDSFAKWKKTSDFKIALETVIEKRGTSSEVRSSKGHQHSDLKAVIEMRTTSSST